MEIDYSCTKIVLPNELKVRIGTDNILPLGMMIHLLWINPTIKYGLERATLEFYGCEGDNIHAQYPTKDFDSIRMKYLWGSVFLPQVFHKYKEMLDDRHVEPMARLKCENKPRIRRGLYSIALTMASCEWIWFMPDEGCWYQRWGGEPTESFEIRTEKFCKLLMHVRQQDAIMHDYVELS